MGDVVMMKRGTWVVPERNYRHKVTGEEVHVTSVEHRPTGAILVRFHYVDAPDLLHRLWAVEFEESYRS